MKLLLVFFISLFAIASASKIEFDKLKFVIQTLGEHPKNRHLSIGLSRQKREIDSVSTISTEIANPTADVSTDEITPAAEIPSAPMTTIAELTTTSEETATTTEVPSTLSVSTGDPTFTVWAVNPSTESTTLAAETSILTDQPTVDTLKNSINEATTAGEIIPSSEPAERADGETLTSISTISNVYLSSGALDALEMIVTVAPKQVSIPAAELTSVPIESTIPVLETTFVAVEPPAGTLFDDLSIEAVPVVPSAKNPASEEKTTDMDDVPITDDMKITLTTESAIPIETTTETSTPPSFPANAFDKSIEDQIKRLKDIRALLRETIRKSERNLGNFQVLLDGSLVPGSKSNNIAARYARFLLSNAEEVKRYQKLEKVMNLWEKLQNILESYPGVSTSKSQPDSSSNASTIGGSEIGGTEI
ncbi:mucin-4-like isoform X2 [Daphnia pulex]|uniref:mucin-4-like isoform X2 n=1 Tax=Daphnia pulex TaxID=6669 RepID=UPI001EDDCF77|nr:mucin-4-like isoform X2 [Daphnia pulex]